MSAVLQGFGLPQASQPTIAPPATWMTVSGAVNGPRNTEPAASRSNPPIATVRAAREGRSTASQSPNCTGA